MDYFANTTLICDPNRTQVMPGQHVPDGAFTEAEAARLLASGAITGYDRMVVEEKPPAPPAPPARSDWAYDPETLKGAGLDVLNMMIAEHVAEHGLAVVEPKASVEEAIAFLSQGWRV